MSKIYITGMGIVSCMGNNMDHFWDGINKTERKMDNVMDLLPLETPKLVDNNTSRRMDRFSNMTLATSKLAFTMRGLVDNEYDPYRIGTIFNTGYGPLNNNLSYARKLVNNGVDMVSPTMFAGTVYNACVGHTCIHLNLKGVSTMLMGSNNIGYSVDLLHADKADIILTGAVEEYCKELSECFQSMTYINKDNQNYFCRPFDEHRNGTKITEGCAVLVLEKEGTPLYDTEKRICEVNGSASAYSSINPVFAVDKFVNKALMNSMALALEESKLRPDEIDGIFAASNGNLYGDLAEADAIKQLFHNTYKELPVTSIKGVVGEAMSASFSMNVIAAALCLKNKQMPPACGCEHLDSDIGLNVLTKPFSHDFKHILVNGYDMGGNVHSIVLSAI